MRPEGLSRQGALSATPDGSQARERTVLWTPWLLYSSRHPTPHPLQPPVSCIRARLVFLPPSGLRTGAAGSNTATEMADYVSGPGQTHLFVSGPVNIPDPVIRAMNHQNEDWGPSLCSVGADGNGYPKSETQWIFFY
ncbi:hypothetical protein PVAP13_6NG269924 [Panicum virgatum]|uniref:Uncharacterized protein n=1 Tax=Panicum virgatum TaxID=38727 RepID=A0A8T0R2I3_PANVG|nr:hypothetical protein PVAP13_6NG269924 [Panicum virgatum]